VPLRFQAPALDLPGHGLTRAPDGYVASLDGNADLVNAIADRLHLGPYVLVGSSMGGAVAWNTVLRHPDRVKALVLVDTAGVSPATDFALALKGASTDGKRTFRSIRKADAGGVPSVVLSPPH
jgi:pimeloyl-ACP methyl ester carboxylesterase